MMKDQNGNTINIGDVVLVDEPTDQDTHLFAFAGNVESFRNEYVVVVDGDGDCFDIEPAKLQVQD